MVSNSSQPVQKCDSTSCRVFVRRADVKKIPHIHTATHGQSVSDNQKTRHYLELITCYIKDKHVTHQLNIYSFVLIITDLSVGHLNLFVVVECIVNCFIKKNYNFVPYFINAESKVILEMFII